jgi:large subunit ribosomal protein L25
MERLSINAERREVQGKGSARSLRREDMIPAVLYREGKAQSIKLARKELSKLINTISGEQVIVDLHFAGGEKKLALLKDYQVDPVSRELLHTDFFEVSLTEAIRVSVHVVTVGEPIGVKRDAGILQYALREVEIQCLPDKIPGKIEFDISKLELGQSVHVSDLKFEEGIKVLTDPGDVIVTVLAQAAEQAPVAEEVAAVAAAEPEVVKKGKKEEAAPEKKEK